VSFTPPRPGKPTRIALLGDLFTTSGRSMLNLLTERAYQVQMGVARIARRRLFVVNAPETVREVMSECPRAFPKHRYITEVLTPLIGYSLFNSNGEAWAQQRRLVDQAFVQAGLRLAFPVMQAAIGDMLARIDEQADGRVWEVDAAMSHITGDIIFRTILSTPLDADQARRVHDAFSQYQQGAQRVMGLSALFLPTFWHWRRCRLMGQQIRDSFAGLVHARYAAIERGDAGLPEDMLAVLVRARDPVTGVRLSADEVVDQIATLFLAGHETSASTLAWALYLLACQPELQQQVREEISAAWGDRDPAYGDTRQLALTQAVFRETLRLYPPISFYLRESAAPACLREKPVGQGDMVVVSPWLIHRHQHLWDRPDEFDPRRFATPEGAASARGAYLPFGTGERACPGSAFATQESLLILAQLVRRFHIHPVEGHVPRPTARLTLRSANGIRLRLAPVRAEAGPAPERNPT
jgi:cytochrome P450